MSIGNRHTVTLFVSGKSEALPEQRLAKVGYKLTQKMKDAGIKEVLPSVCASIPQIKPEELKDHYEALAPFMISMLEETQNSIVRASYEACKGVLPLSVSDEELSVGACIGFLSAAQFTDAECLSKWFKECVEDNLTVVACESLSCDDPEDARVQQQVSIRRDYLAGLTAEKVFYTPNQIRVVRRMLELASESSAGTSVRAVALIEQKLDQMEKKPVEDALEL
jgi:hypothetical protein